MADIQNLEGIVFSPEVKLPTENGVGAVQPIVFSGTTLFYNSKESFPAIGDASLLFVDTIRKQLYKWNDQTNGYEAITMSREEAESIFALKQEGVYYVAGNTTGTKGVWTGTNARITEYYDGLVINYKVGIEGASTTTLNINNLGAKTVYLRGTTKVTTHYGVGTMVLLSYNAAKNAFYTADYDANNYAYVRQYTTNTSGEYPLLFAYETTLPESYDTKYTRKNAGITVNPATGSISAAKHITTGSSNQYVVLGDGSTKAISDFALDSQLPDFNNYVTLNTAQTISGVKTFSTQQKFTVADGTAPFTVTSSTKVVNLNADKTDGFNINDYGYKYQSSASISLVRANLVNVDAPIYVKMTTQNKYHSQHVRFKVMGGYDNVSGSTEVASYCRAQNEFYFDSVYYNGNKLIGVYQPSANTDLYYLKFSKFAGTYASNPNTGTISVLAQVPGITLTLVQEGDTDYAAMSSAAYIAVPDKGIYGSHLWNDMYPAANNKYNLGSSGYKWKAIHGTTLYENGVSLADKYLQKVNLPSILIDDTTDRETHPFIGSLEADGHTITVNRQTLKDVGLNTVYRFRGTCTWDELLKKGAVLGDVWNIKKEDDDGNLIMDPEGNIGADWVCYNEDGVPESGIEPSQYAEYWQSLGGYVDLSSYVEGPASSTANALARYEDSSGKRLKNSSATLTDDGKLSVDTLNIKNTGAVSHITLERGGWNYIQAPKTDSIIAFIAGQEGTVAANATLAIDNTAIFPGWTNNVKNIGSSQYKWNNVYAKTYYENDKTLAELYAALDHEHSASNITDLNKILESYIKKDVVATSTTLGLVKLGSDTKQTIAAQTVSSTKNRTYAVQLNSSNQMVVNVPWVDNNDNTWRPIKCGSTTLNDNTTTLEFVAGSNTTLNFTNGKLTITGTGDTKVTNTLNNNVKYYVTGTTSASTETGTQVFDNKVYVSEVAGALHATTYNIDTNATMKYDSVAQCIRFVIN